MKIDRIECVRADVWLFVLIGTDSGLEGIGEAGCWALPDAAAAAVEACDRSC